MFPCRATRVPCWNLVRPFNLGFRRFSRKKDPWKEWKWKVPLEPPRIRWFSYPQKARNLRICLFLVKHSHETKRKGRNPRLLRKTKTGQETPRKHTSPHVPAAKKNLIRVLHVRSDQQQYTCLDVEHFCKNHGDSRPKMMVGEFLLIYRFLCFNMASLRGQVH